MLPYQIVLTLGAILLAIVHLFDTRVSLTNRAVIMLMVVVSFAMPSAIAGRVAAIVLQLSAGLYVLLRRQAQRGR